MKEQEKDRDEWGTEKRQCWTEQREAVREECFEKKSPGKKDQSERSVCPEMT